MKPDVGCLLSKFLSQALAYLSLQRKNQSVNAKINKLDDIIYHTKEETAANPFSPATTLARAEPMVTIGPKDFDKESIMLGNEISFSFTSWSERTRARKIVFFVNIRERGLVVARIFTVLFRRLEPLIIMGRILYHDSCKPKDFPVLVILTFEDGNSRYNGITPRMLKQAPLPQRHAILSFLSL
jgi:hypothetical protein